MQGFAVIVTALLVGSVTGQATTASSTSDGLVGTITSAAGAVYTNPLIKSLWSDAVSLISSHYPSTSVTNVASLTWPSEVVIGSSTATVTPSATSSSISSSPTTSSMPTTTPAAATGNTSSASAATKDNDSHNTSTHTDKRLGIALGVCLGLVALGVLILLIWLLHRRKKQTGTFARHGHNSVSDSEIQAWRDPSSHSSSDFPEKYYSANAPHAPMPPMQTHAAYAQGYGYNNQYRAGDYSSNESNPFNTTYESYSEMAANSSQQVPLHELHAESTMQMLGDHRPAPLNTRAAESTARPSTPYAPAAMLDTMNPVSPVSPADDAPHGGFWQHSRDHANPYQQQHSDRYLAEDHSLHHESNSSNPFLSEEDDMLDAPPGIPTRSPNRRSSPAVHYPPGDELSTFDFGLAESRKRWASERHVDGEDGWHKQDMFPRRESVNGRHEMA